MKSFKQFNETVERRRSPDENRFIDKHVVDKKEHPVAKDDQFVAKNKKDKTKAASYKDGQDKEVYEEVELDEAKATVKQKAALKALMTKALGGKRAGPGFTSSIATNGDFVVYDGGMRIQGRIKAGEFQNPLKEEIDEAKLMTQADRIKALNKSSKAKMKSNLVKLQKARKTNEEIEDLDLDEEKDTHTTKDGRTAKKGLWYNIMMKKKRGEKPAPKGDPDRPSEQDLKDARKTSKEEVELDEEQKLFMFKTKQEAEKKAKEVKGKVVSLTKQNFAVVAEEVELDEAPMPKWNAKVGKKTYTVSARNPAEANRKANALAKKENNYGVPTGLIKKVEEQVDLDEAPQPKWKVAIGKKHYTVTARNTAEADRKAKILAKKEGNNGVGGKIERMSEEAELNEGVIDDLRNIVKTKSAKDVKFAGGGKAKVDMFTASAMVKVYDALNDANKKKFADAINKNENMFMKMMDFAMSKVK